ncbi:RNA-directed DNA polymerase, eukaryota, reverse transcriptase zinc-binding domain protein [Tanacetum coccineum]
MIVQEDLAIMDLYGEEFLRKPTYTDMEKLYAHHEEKHGFPGMAGNIDCTDWLWENCPVAFRAQFSRDSDADSDRCRFRFRCRCRAQNYTNKKIQTADSDSRQRIQTTDSIRQQIQTDSRHEIQTALQTANITKYPMQNDARPDKTRRMQSQM